MAISVNPSGPYQLDRNQIHSYAAYATYTFFSGQIVTTDSFENNILNFGAPLKELFIYNVGANPIAFQFPELYSTAAITPPNASNLASGICLPNYPVIFRSLNKQGMKVRSLSNGSQSTLYIFGI
jgi:hypothetical protein